MKTCYLILPVLLLTACTRQPEQPTIELSFADAIECASIPEARWYSHEDILHAIDSIENYVESAEDPVGVLVTPSFASDTKWYAASPLGFLFRSTEVICTGLLSGVRDTVNADAWYFGDSLVGLRFESLWLDSGTSWSLSAPFEPISTGDLKNSRSGLWQAISLCETDHQPDERRYLFRGDFEVSWIAVVEESEHTSSDEEYILVFITLVRDVDYLDLLNPQLKSRIDTMTTHVGHARGVFLYGPEFADRYRAILPPTLEADAWYPDSTCGERPFALFYGIAGETEIGETLVHSTRGVPFYVLSAEVVSGTVPD